MDLYDIAKRIAGIKREGDIDDALDDLLSHIEEVEKEENNNESKEKH